MRQVDPIRQGDIPGVQLRCRIELPVGAEEAWRWLSETAAVSRWWADSVVVRPGPDGGFDLARREAAENVPVAEGATLEWQPPRRWMATYRSLEPEWPAATRLLLEVTPTAHGSEVSVLQSGFEHLPLSECLTIWEAYRRRWRAALDRLAATVAS